MIKAGNDLCKFLFLVISFVNYVKCGIYKLLIGNLNSSIAWNFTDDGYRLDELPEHETNPDFTLIDDMILAPEQYDVLFNNVSRRTGYIQAVRIWPNATVPYHFDNNFSKSCIFQ